jgi:hypothetical protein
MDFDTTDFKVYKYTIKFKFSEYETEFEPRIREHDLRVDFHVRYQMRKQLMVRMLQDFKKALA